MKQAMKRVAIHVGADHGPGLDPVLTGAVLAAHELSWQVIAIRDGYEGLLFPERYARGGTVDLDPHTMTGAGGVELGRSGLDPFRLHVLDGDEVAEVDRSAELVERLRAQRIDALISIAGRRALSVAWKLQRKGLPTICVPVSVENDLTATDVSLGFSTTLAFTVELLDRARQAALAARRVAVVEVLGRHAGWLALQAGTAAQADAILIPELSATPDSLAAALERRRARGFRPALVVVAEGAELVQECSPGAAREVDIVEARRRALSPGSSSGDPDRVIERSGALARAIALELRRRLSLDALPLAVGSLLRGGTPNAVDRQLGLASGAAAVQGLHRGETGAVVAFHPPKLEFMALAEVVNQIRRVPPDSHFLQVARIMGVTFGDSRRAS